MDATPISGPAWVYSTASDSRGICDPLVLQTASTLAFCRRACRIASRVSIVSPDWLTATTSVSRSSTGSR